MLAAITAFFTSLPVIVPVLVKVLAPVFALLGAWLLPSPLQKAAKAPAEVQDAEKKADTGDPSGLDHP